MVATFGRILVINTGFPEMDYLAAALYSNDMLSHYVRPYVNKSRLWERALRSTPIAGAIFKRTFGRRALPDGLPPESIREVAILRDLTMAVAARLPIGLRSRDWRRRITLARHQVVGNAGARALEKERAVIASWGCAAPAFRNARHRGAFCILNYPLAHHRFARRLLMEEAEREPEFAGTLNSHDHPKWFEEQLDLEISLADHILVGSSFVRNSFVDEGVPAKKVSIIPYGADPGLFEPLRDKPLDRRFNVLFVGQISQRKGISYLLRAYERFRAPDTSLTLVGRLQGDDSAIRPFQHLFTHINHVPRPYLREIYQQADVFVFPTLVEGMPLVVLEAMASGLPVICTPNGPGDIVRDGIDGFVVPIRDVGALIDRLNCLRVNPTLRAEMAENARARALQFSWKVYQQTAVFRLREQVGLPLSVHPGAT